MNRFNNLGYGFVVGVVRVFESKLIKPDEFVRLKACKTEDEFAFELKNLNYGAVNFSGLYDFNLILNRIFCDVVFELKKNCPAFAPFDVVFFDNDCFNLQVVLTAKKRGFFYDKFVLKPGFLPISLFENDLNCLPESVFDLAIELNSLLSCGASNFEIFVEFNKKVFKKKLSLCAFSSFLFERTRLNIDFHNFRLALKALSLKLNEIELGEALVPGGAVDYNLILKAFGEGVGSLGKFFGLSLGVNINEVLRNSELVDEIVFKKFFDFDFRMGNQPFSFAAVVSYLHKLQYEHRALKKILTKIALQK